MKVYVAIGQVDYEFSDVLGVFSAREAAAKCCVARRAKQLAANAEVMYHRYYIEDWELDVAGPVSTRVFSTVGDGHWRLLKR